MLAWDRFRIFMADFWFTLVPTLSLKSGHWSARRIVFQSWDEDESFTINSSNKVLETFKYFQLATFLCCGAKLRWTLFFSWPYPRHVFQCLGFEIQSGMGFQINWYYMAFLQLSSWSRCIFYFISLTSTVSSGRVLRRGRPGSTVLTGVRRAAVNRIVPLALVHNLYTPLVTACQGFILFWCYQ